MFPPTLFECDDGQEAEWWTCVRTRPRWEKKFARWLQEKRMPYFLPTFTRTRISHRKRRTTTEPLFPGYVFVKGDHQKGFFTQSASVVRCLNPRSAEETSEFDRQLRNIWRAAASGLPIAPTPRLFAGQTIEIVDGPLQGTVGLFREDGKQGSIILAVDMLGVGVRVNLPPEYRFNVVD